MVCVLRVCQLAPLAKPNLICANVSKRPIFNMKCVEEASSGVAKAATVGVRQYLVLEELPMLDVLPKHTSCTLLRFGHLLLSCV